MSKGGEIIWHAKEKEVKKEKEKENKGGEKCMEQKQNQNEELKHYGVLGMKWGHRKSKSVMSAKKDYKTARKELRKAKIKKMFDSSSYIAGTNNVKRNKQLTKNIERLKTKKENAAFKLTDSQAKYAYDKKLSKTGNKDKANKSSMKVYEKSLIKKMGGLPGSINDARSGGKDTRYIKHVTKVKGKKFADKIESRVKKKAIAACVGSVAVGVGIAAYDIYKYKNI